nr:hypothetical protein [Marinobacter segnicrescens]
MTNDASKVGQQHRLPIGWPLTAISTALEHVGEFEPPHMDSGFSQAPGKAAHKRAVTARASAMGKDQPWGITRIRNGWFIDQVLHVATSPKATKLILRYVLSGASNGRESTHRRQLSVFIDEYRKNGSIVHHSKIKQIRHHTDFSGITVTNGVDLSHCKQVIDSPYLRRFSFPPLNPLVRL